MFEDLYYEEEKRDDFGSSTFPLMFLMAFGNSTTGLANAVLLKNSKERF
ncbi:MAG: hypothetical protein HDP34_03905 [Clostridia bacterium]|nr:hypothetical protein [Clostridia bacterium]